MTPDEPKDDAQPEYPRIFGAGETTWDDGIPQGRTLDSLIDDTMAKEPTIVTVDTVGYDEDGDPIRRVVRFKPPFDPLKAGWVTCEWCNGTGEDFGSFQCEHCDGLGIVVGPPEDGLEIARMASVKRSHLRSMEPGSLLHSYVLKANAYKGGKR